MTVSNCSVRVSQSLQSFLFLLCLSAISTQFLHYLYSELKSYNNAPILSRTGMILPAYSPLPFIPAK